MTKANSGLVEWFGYKSVCGKCEALSSNPSAAKRKKKNNTKANIKKLILGMSNTDLYN
jgi:hypothetical protein